MIHYLLLCGERVVQRGIAQDESCIPRVEGYRCEVIEANDPRLPAAPCTDYRDFRRLAYPSLGDQLDALWKGGEAAEAMRQQIAAIKARFPEENS